MEEPSCATLDSPGHNGSRLFLVVSRKAAPSAQSAPAQRGQSGKPGSNGHRCCILASEMREVLETMELAGLQGLRVTGPLEHDGVELLDQIFSDSRRVGLGGLRSTDCVLGASAAPRRVFLIGFMGAGKTTDGKILAAMLGRRFIDVDDIVEARAGKTVPAIFAEDGEKAYRRLESEALKEAATTASNAVIATGGGIVCRSENRAILAQSGLCVLLVADADTIFQRTAGSSRPLLQCGDPLGRIKTLLEARKSRYAACAHWIIQTSRQDPESICASIRAQIERLAGLDALFARRAQDSQAR